MISANPTTISPPVVLLGFPLPSVVSGLPLTVGKLSRCPKAHKGTEGEAESSNFGIGLALAPFQIALFCPIWN